MATNQWDDALGRYVEGIPEVVYNGNGIVSSKGWNPRQEVSTGQTMTVETYEISIPLENIEILEDDLVEVVTSTRSQYLLGKIFVVKAQVLTSYAVSQKVLAEIWNGKRPR